MSALIALLISAAIAACIVTFLRRREERKSLDRKTSGPQTNADPVPSPQSEERQHLVSKTFVRRSATSFGVVVVVGGILIAIIVVWMFISAIASMSGCFNC